jgi:RNA polymerase sigma-70 factor (ECF subfamily)
MEMAETELVGRARSGDERAFADLVGPYRHELLVHCYRFLGSLADAEDAVQESLTAAWRGLPGYEGRASMRTWLYKIATSRCVNMLRSASRHTPAKRPSLDFDPPEPSRLGEVVWLEPYPDILIAEIPDTAAGPLAQYEQREAISLAFITALQVLSPRQRAALILSDVLEFGARDVAHMLGTTEHSVYAQVKRARSALAKQIPESQPPALPDSPAERRVLSQLVRAWEECNTEALVALMTDDVWLRMPPNPLEYQGRDLARRWFATIAFRDGRRFRLIPTRANGQPAFGIYLYSELSRTAHAFGLVVITLTADHVSAITKFENSVMPRFGLPRSV